MFLIVLWRRSTRADSRLTKGYSQITEADPLTPDNWRTKLEKKRSGKKIISYEQGG